VTSSSVFDLSSTSFFTDPQRVKKRKIFLTLLTLDVQLMKMFQRSVMTSQKLTMANGSTIHVKGMEYVKEVTVFHMRVSGSMTSVMAMV